jgi:hypothetical protein
MDVPMKVSKKSAKGRLIFTTLTALLADCASGMERVGWPVREQLFPAAAVVKNALTHSLTRPAAWILIRLDL